MKPLALLALTLVFVSGAAARASAPPTTLGNLVPPRVVVTHAASGASPGYLFVAEKLAGKPGGPMILDNAGRLVWFHPVGSPLQATDFRVQRYRGHPVLTWWEGKINKAGVGQGRDVVYDASYRQVAAVSAAHGLKADLHEFELTPRGTAYITAYNELPIDLSGVGGPTQAYVLDSVVQEIDVATGKLVFEWHSLGHVPIADSRVANAEPAQHASKKRPLDYFHVNSVADGPNGTVLISARNTSVLYDVARSGKIIWQFGGRHSDFGPAGAVKLNYQHNARLHPGGLLTVFDNGAIPKAEPYTRPEVLKLDFAHKTAHVVKTFLRPQHLLSPYEGNLELLPSGGAVVGWGGIPRVTEFAPDGRVRLEVKLPYGDTYRGFKFAWTGAPATKPLVATGDGIVAASWNGRTGIARWIVLGGEDASHMTKLGEAPWRGLETRIPVGQLPKVVVVQAVDASGRVLGSS